MVEDKENTANAGQEPVSKKAAKKQAKAAKVSCNVAQFLLITCIIDVFYTLSHSLLRKPS